MTKYQLEENKIVKVQEGNKFLGSFRMPKKLKEITLNAARKKCWSGDVRKRSFSVMNRTDWDFLKPYLLNDKQFYDKKGKFIGYQDNYWYLIFEDGDFIFLPQRVMEKEHFIYY